MTAYRHARPRRRLRVGRLLALLLVLGLVAGGTTAALNRFLGGSALADQPVTVTIPKGVGAGEVAAILDEAGVIRSPFLFRFQSRFDDRAAEIRPGTYELEPGMSTADILAILSAPPEAAPTFTVTIPEGLTVDETLRRLAEAEGSPFSRKQLRRALRKVAVPEWVPQDLPEGAEPFEGLLFPNTYQFRVASRPEEVLSELVAQTEKVMAGVTPPQGFTPYEVLTAGSLIEREARIRSEQPKIASVIHNRLDEGMPLQIDATVLYALGEHKERVLYSDLEVDSPWNTYAQPGLPPTPISGAGEAAIRAAANPADTDFLYYVVVNPETGEHAFSETYDEFLQNKNAAGG